MQRRGFLQAFAAVAAGLAGGGGAIASTLAKTPPSEPLVDIPLAPRGFASVSDSGPAAVLASPQATLLEMLKECRAITKQEVVTTYGCRLVTLTYRHRPDGPRSELDDEADAIAASMSPRSASVTTGLANVDPFDADSLIYGYGFMEEVCEIEVEWIG